MNNEWKYRNAIKKLHVETEVQKALFLGEYEGQISDGMWENSLPTDHWVAWMLKPEQVVVDGTLGYEGFSPRKYNLKSKELLEIVGGRMCCIANLATHGYTDLNTLNALDSVFDGSTGVLPKDKAAKVYENLKGNSKLAELFPSFEEAYEAICTPFQHVKDLKKEIVGLHQAVNNPIFSKIPESVSKLTEEEDQRELFSIDDTLQNVRASEELKAQIKTIATELSQKAGDLISKRIAGFIQRKLSEMGYEESLDKIADIEDSDIYFMFWHELGADFIEAFQENFPIPFLDD